MAGDPIASSSTISSSSFFSRLRRMAWFSKNQPGQQLRSSTPREPPPPPQQYSTVFERVFRQFDENGDGKVSPIELRNCMRTSGGVELSIEDAEEAVRSTDSDGDGLLSMEDFVRLVGAGREELRAAFAAYEMEGRGCITPKSLKRALEQLGDDQTTVEECREMIRRFDLDRDGVMSFEEFSIMMTN